MKSKIIFKIIEESNCPHYVQGDCFTLSGKAIALEPKKENTFITTGVLKFPLEKSICRSLVKDITSILIMNDNLFNLTQYTTNCSGCSGLIKIRYSRETAYSDQKLTKENRLMNAVTNMLASFPLFQSLRHEDIQNVVKMLRLKKYVKNDIIMKTNDPPSYLYIMVSGRVEVLGDKDIHIAFMGKGDVFGEMSLLSGDPVGATIRVTESTRVLYLTGTNFRKVLNRYSSLQMYFSRILAQRLARTNIEMSEQLSSGIIGRLSEMPPSELFQTLNVNQKTGLLNLKLSRGAACVAFREGSMVRVEYNKKQGRDAFYDILTEKEGRFKFSPDLPDKDQDTPEIGDFMWLLMEGLNKVDEDAA